MHMQNQPENMQLNPQYPNGVVGEISHWLQRQIDTVLQEGIEPKNIHLHYGHSAFTYPDKIVQMQLFQDVIGKGFSFQFKLHI